MRVLLLLIAPLLAVTCGAAPDVGAFLDGYARALASGGSVTAGIHREETFNGRRVREDVRGLVTYHGGDDPFLRMTASRVPLDGTPGTALAVSCRGGRVLLGDSATETAHAEVLALGGGHLISTRADGDLLLLMYPALLDGLRRDPTATVETRNAGRLNIDRLSVKGSRGHFMLDVDAATYLPLRIERREQTEAGESRKVILFDGTEVSPRKPPAELFAESTLLEFPITRYDPTGLLGTPVPDLRLALDDGSVFDVKDYEGHPMLLHFSASWSQASAELDPLINRVGLRAMEAGAAYVMLDLWNDGPRSTGRSPVPRASGEAAGRLFNIERVGVPCLIVVGKDGKVGEVLMGYIPGVTEAVLEKLL